MQSPRLTTLALPFVLLACKAQPAEPVVRTEFLDEGTLEQVQPADVAVAPVHNQSGAESMPAGALRKAIYEGLVTRLYSPVDLGYVDARLAEASADPEALGADAVMYVVVTAWDTSILESAAAIRVSASVTIVEPGSAAAASPLWGVEVSRRIDLRGEARVYPERAELERRAAELFAAEVLALLPERDPLAEPR